MKTCQSTGYFQRVYIRSLLCFISSVVFAGSAQAFTAPNTINQCFDCHGSPTTAAGGGNDIRPVDSTYRNVTTGAFVGNHRTHIPALTTNPQSCTPCHGQAPANMDHRDGVINMRLHINSSAVNVRGYYNKPVGSPAAFFNQTSAPQQSTCNNVNCHFRTTSPIWGVAPLTGGQTPASNCSVCHSGTGMATGNHSNHISALGGTLTACNSCHPSNITFSHATSAKPTKSISVSLSTGTFAKGTHVDYPNYLPGSIAGTYGTCNNTQCHGTGSSPQWNTTNTDDTCVKCHGAAGTASGSLNSGNRYLSAPPRSVAGTAGTLTGTGQVSNNTKVGAHQTHLRFFNGYSNYSTVDFRCQGCHGTLPSSGNHASGSSTPNGSWSNLAIRGGKAPNFNSANLTCSNTYCHNPAGATGGLNAANTGTNVFPSWTSASYMANGTRITAPTNCSKCHKVPGDSGFTSTFNHGATTIANPCSGCHGHEGDASGAAGQRHMDGFKWGGGGTTCDGCHDYDNVGGAWGTVKNANYYSYTPVNQSIGAHYKHIEHLKKRWNITLNATTDFGVGFGLGNAAKVCGTCHTNSSGNHMDTNRNINFGDGLSTINGVPMVLGTGPATYNGSGSYGVYASGNRTCSNLSCHYFTTPLWSTY